MTPTFETNACSPNLDVLLIVPAMGQWDKLSAFDKGHRVLNKLFLSQMEKRGPSQG